MKVISVWLDRVRWSMKSIVLGLKPYRLGAVRADVRNIEAISNSGRS